MNFEFATATQIIFGPGTIKQVAPAAVKLGGAAPHALLVTGKTGARAKVFAEALVANGVKTTAFNVPGEPTDTLVRDGLAQAREAGCTLVIGIGGGSVIDAGKAIAATLTNPGDLLDYLEVIGRGQPLTQPSAPFIAIPTTAGTGAEVTRNAVLASEEKRVKVSLRSPLMLPRLAVIDPELTRSMPPEITAATGMDAFAQVLEPYVSLGANPITDSLCREGLMRVSSALRQAYSHGDDAEAREDMALVSLFGGLALANAKLGAVHGLAGVLGGMTGAPHGALCGRLLPFVMDANVRALRKREPKHPALERYDEIAVILSGEWDVEAGDAVTWVQALCKDLKIRGLASYGVRAQDFPTIVEKASQASSMKGNPIQLTEAELRGVLERAL
ncbi:MAG: iron-containing alcohol dehydrogenase [Anaerolineae bacterium]|nr:iron-containing alcohol dehydrogenase [Anaerolineae bacterium]